MFNKKNINYECNLDEVIFDLKEKQKYFWKRQMYF
jgi:hypothetical protein